MIDNLNIETKTPTSEWTEKDWNKFSKWLLDMLKSHTITVTFTKKDGTERVMDCTLNPTIVPQKVTLTENKERKKSEANIPVYDVQAKGWRSFVIKSVKNIRFTI